MKFTTYLQDGQPRLGLVDGDAVIDLNAAQPLVPASLRAALAAGLDLAAAAQAALASTAPASSTCPMPIHACPPTCAPRLQPAST